MNRKRVKEWSDALLSGEYAQGRYRLFNEEENGYCCWGVLCELSEIPFQREASFPSSPVYDWLGWDDSRPEWSLGDENESGLPEPEVNIPDDLIHVIRSYVPPEYDAVEIKGMNLSELNDYYVPFDIIAEIIRRNWL